MGLYERKSAVLDGFEWRCRMGMFAISQDIYGGSLMVNRLAMRSFRFFKGCCYAVPSTRKRSAVRNTYTPCSALFIHVTIVGFPWCHLVLALRSFRFIAKGVGSPRILPEI
ncbi:hypothetical protein TNCV_3972631 [Trichonephila clavipes]|nr:hypothetical protein TNCV_3972631 [Trichonephila clavipes]